MHPVGIHTPFTFWKLKIYICPPFPENSKICITCWETSNSYITRAPLKTDERCLQQRGGFWGRTIWWRYWNLPQTVLCCFGNQMIVSEHKIGYNSGCIRETAKILAPNREFSRSAKQNDQGATTKLDIIQVIDGLSTVRMSTVVEQLTPNSDHLLWSSKVYLVLVVRSEDFESLLLLAWSSSIVCMILIVM